MSGAASQRGGEREAPQGEGPWLVRSPSGRWAVECRPDEAKRVQWLDGWKCISLSRVHAADAMVQAMRDAKLQIEQGAEGFAVDTLDAALQQAGEQP